MNPGERDASRTATAMALAIERLDAPSAQALFDAAPDRGALLSGLSALPGVLWQRAGVTVSLEKTLEDLASFLASGGDL